jgi:hypothetical protein
MAARRGVGLEFAFFDPVDDGGLGNVTIPGSLPSGQGLGRIMTDFTIILFLNEL